MYSEAIHREVSEEFANMSDVCTTVTDGVFEDYLSGMTNEQDNNELMRATIKTVGISLSASICTLANAILTAASTRSSDDRMLRESVGDVAHSIACYLSEAVSNIGNSLSYAYEGVDVTLNGEINVLSETKEERDERHMEEIRLSMKHVNNKEYRINHNNLCGGNKK